MQCMEIRGGSTVVEEAFSTPGLDAWVCSLPFEGATRGGDLHYVSLCGGGVITRMIVADVSGHGAPVADLSASLRGLMRRAINTKSQTHLVRELNRQFAALERSGRFATAVVATYLANRRTLTICNAGHPRPLRYRAADGRWDILDAEHHDPGNLPLGLEDETPYQQFTIALGPGDAIVLYTDALTEAADPSGRMLGETGLLSLARSLDPADPQLLGRSILAGAEAYRGGAVSDDDSTVLVAVHGGEGPRRMSVVEKLDVYAKVFGIRNY